MSDVDREVTAVLVKKLWDAYIPNAQNDFVEMLAKWIDARGFLVLSPEMRLDELDLTQATAGTKVFVAYLKLLLATITNSLEGVEKQLRELETLCPSKGFGTMHIVETRDLCMEMNRKK